MEQVLECVEPLRERFEQVDETVGSPEISAIVAVDVAASTQRVAELGDAEAWREYQRLRGMFGAMTTTHHGQIDMECGDGVISRFGSLANATAAAMCMVAAAPEVSSLHATAPVRVRAGVHLGELLVDDAGHSFGLAVAVAVRVCDAGAVGRVTLSDDAAARLDDEGWGCLEPLGQADLKGLREPMRLWRVEAVTPPRPFPLYVPVPFGQE